MKYLVEKEIRTSSELIDPFEYEGYRFRHWHFDIKNGWLGEAWIVSKEIDANSYEEAYNIFSEKLSFILSRIAFVSQCYVDDVYRSCAVVKLENNDERYVFLRKTEEKGVSKLCFQKVDIDNLKNISQLKNSEFFLRMHISNNSLTYRSRLISLIHAVESLAGEKKKNIECTNCGDLSSYSTLNHSAARKILSNRKLYQKIWGPEGIRNKLMHGLEHSLDEDYLKLIYDSILNFINETYDVDIPYVVNPQRHMYGNMVYKQFVYQVDDLARFDLKTVIENFDSDRMMKDNNSAFLAKY